MDRNEVIRMAKETAAKLHGVTDATMTPEAEAWAIEFAELVAAAEREKCANRLSTVACHGSCKSMCAAAIRALT